MWCKICRDGHLRLHFSSHIGCPHCGGTSLWTRPLVRWLGGLSLGWLVGGLLCLSWFQVSLPMLLSEHSLWWAIMLLSTEPVFGSCINRICNLKAWSGSEHTLAFCYCNRPRGVWSSLGKINYMMNSKMPKSVPNGEKSGHVGFSTGQSNLKGHFSNKTVCK